MSRAPAARRRVIRLTLAVLVAGFVAFCVLVNEGVHGVRLDLTEGRLYTLSDGTRRIAAALDAPVELRFYYSRALGEASPYLGVYATRVRELLAEIAAASGGRLRVTVIDPAPFSADEDHAAEYGLTPVPLTAGGTQGWFGLAGTNSTHGRQMIPFFQPEREAFLEYDLARLLQQLGAAQRPVVGLLTTLPATAGFDPATQQMRDPWAVFDELRTGFDLRPLEPSITAVPADVRVLIVAHPQRLPEPALFAIDQYVLRGGRLLLFVDPSAEQVPPSAAESFGPAPATRSSDLAPLLRAWGLRYDPRRIVLDDAQALAVAAGEHGGPVRHPGFLGIDAAHMARDDVTTSNLQRINFASAGELAPVAGAGTTFQPLLWSSDVATTVDAARLAGLRDPSDLYRDFKPGGEHFVLAARISGRPRSAFTRAPAGGSPPLTVARADVHVIVVADTDLLSDLLWVRTDNLFGQRYRTPWADNGAFVLNAVDNLAGSADLISLRGRRIAQRPFTRVEELRRLADERLRRKAGELEAALATTEQRLAALEGRRGSAGAVPPQAGQAELQRFQQERLRIRQELRAVRRDLDVDIESLGRVLRIVNILVAPLVLVALVALVARRRSRRGS
ncbi:MAG: Gldg family protein [Steroidobacteraceae bacterium]